MMRAILLPGAVLMLFGIGGVGYFLWDVFHSQFQSNWDVTEAYDGDLAAERHLALCYKTGCTNVPRDPDSACAWWQIVASDARHVSGADILAERAACNRLSAEDLNLVGTLEDDIRMKMRAQKIRRSEIDDRVSRTKI